MGTLDAIEWLTSVVRAGSFAGAARRLGVTASAVSRRVAKLEDDLGVQLLARTTRSLVLTEDGRAFHDRCVRVLEELEEARAVLARAGKEPAGTLRVDAPLALGREALAPALTTFAGRHPRIRVDLTVRDQFVDPIAEGIDVLVRIGPLRDSSLYARRLGESKIVHCASPRYGAANRLPRTLVELEAHAHVAFLREGRPTPLRFFRDGALVEVEPRVSFGANDAAVLRRLALDGHGIAALFDFLVKDDLATGALVEVLPDHETQHWPIHALYPKNRHLLPKVGAFLEFLQELFSPRPPPELSAKARARRPKDERRASRRRPKRS